MRSVVEAANDSPVVRAAINASGRMRASIGRSRRLRLNSDDQHSMQLAVRSSHAKEHHERVGLLTLLGDGFFTTLDGVYAARKPAIVEPATFTFLPSSTVRW